MNEKRHISVKLPQAIVETLDEIAAKEGISRSEVLIQTLAYVFYSEHDFKSNYLNIHDKLDALIKRLNQAEMLKLS